MSRRFRMPGQFWKSIAQYIDKAPISSEDKDRLYHYTVFILLGIPTMSVFIVYHLINQNYGLAITIITSCVGLTIGWFILRNFQNGIIIYRINGLLFGLLILFLLIKGGEEGSQILWMYIYPLITFFLLGKNEGLFWSLSIFIIALYLLFIPENIISVYPYSEHLKIRFIATYVMVGTITFWFEFFRQRFRKGMELEQIKLEKEKTELQIQIEEREKTEKEKEEVIQKLKNALDMVNKLSGFLPICSRCHKIRDESGKWNQLESYIRDHSDVEFSHSVCPDCVNKLYPELDSDK